MIKTAQDAYLAGRQAAMEKLAEGVMDNQANVLKQIGLGGEGLYDSPGADAGVLAYLDPSRLASMQNLSRLGMLGGAAGGAYLGGMDPRAAAIASAGALGGGYAGGNLAQGIGAAINQFSEDENKPIIKKELMDQLIAGGGALGGAGGGLAAGRYLA
jgi:hypothetical protein